jgi:hypothetical protein
MTKRTRIFLAGVAGLVAVSLLPLRVDADHSWGKYRWDSSVIPVPLDIGDNLTGPWSAHLAQAVADWDSGTPDVLDLQLGAGASDADCSPTLWRIEVCNGFYGANGWLGIARIWITRGSRIAQATTQVNDTYFEGPYGYGTDNWRQLVTCQEVGHTFGLDHQDENFDNPNLGSCMDYTSDPVGNTAPNQHDFDQLAAIYVGDGGKKGGGGNGRRGRAPAGADGCTGTVGSARQGQRSGRTVRPRPGRGQSHPDVRHLGVGRTAPTHGGHGTPAPTGPTRAP